MSKLMTIYQPKWIVVSSAAIVPADMSSGTVYPV